MQIPAQIALPVAATLARAVGMGPPMMMMLGMFPMMLETLPYDSLQHHTAWRHASNSRVGVRPATQFLGPDDETIQLSAKLLPAITGGSATIESLRAMAATGKAWPLIEGTGVFYGLFVIESIDSTKSVFFQDGAARQIDFQMQLKRVDVDQIDMLANVKDMLSLVGL